MIAQSFTTNNIAGEYLYELVVQDPSLCEDGQRLSASLEARCKGGYAPELEALQLVQRVGVVRELSTNTADVQDALVARLASEIANKNDIAVDVAAWAVESWAVAMRGVARHTVSVATQPGDALALQPRAVAGDIEAITQLARRYG